MGQQKRPVTVIEISKEELPLSKPPERRHPRSYFEWKTLRSWGKLPDWEFLSPGYLLREAREKAGLTQAQLAKKLGCTQQAIAQAERWESNPSVKFMRDWCEAIDAELTLEIRP